LIARLPGGYYEVPNLFVEWAEQGGVDEEIEILLDDSESPA